MRISDLYWSLKLGRDWVHHPQFKLHMKKEVEKLQKALEVGGRIEDAICIDDLPPPPPFEWPPK